MNNMRKFNFIMTLLVVILVLVLTCMAQDKNKNDDIMSEIYTRAETETEYIETETETELQPNDYTDEDLYILSHIIQCEAGYCERAMMEGVGSVVLNRVADPRFPNTIYEVVNQPGQYRPVMDGIFTSAEPTELVMEVAIDLLQWGSKYPPEVVWQANFPQGQGTYLTLSTSYSTMYFCY